MSRQPRHAISRTDAEYRIDRPMVERRSGKIGRGQQHGSESDCELQRLLHDVSI